MPLANGKPTKSQVPLSYHTCAVLSALTFRYCPLRRTNVHLVLRCCITLELSPQSSSNFVPNSCNRAPRFPELFRKRVDRSRRAPDSV